MNTTFKSTNDQLLAQVRELASERFRSLERVLADAASLAQLDIEIERETKQQSGRVYRVSANLAVDGSVYHAEEWDETAELAIDRVRDELVREVRNDRKRSQSLLRRSGAAFKTLLRFGQS